MRQLRHARVILFLIDAGYEMLPASEPLKISGASWTATVYSDPETHEGALVVGII